MQRALISFLLLVSLAALPALAVEKPEDAILGLWLTAPSEGGRSRVEVVRSGNGYSGHIVWLELPEYPPDDPGDMGGLPRVNRNHPDPAHQKEPVLGLQVLEGFRYAGGTEWEDGTIYDPNNGKTYRCRLRLQEDGSLHVRGFIGFSFLGRTTIWVRPEAEEEVP